MITIHYDCDPGQDDAIALLYALGSQNIDINSLSVVGGNVDVEQCAKNALQILDLAKRNDIDVFVGAGKPLKRELITLPEVFGVTGMAGAEDLPLPQKAASSLNTETDFSELIHDRVVVATGPLTNLAICFQKNPLYAKSIKHLFIMGGCVYPEPVHKRIGNFRVPGTDGYAEYNFACDPDAAKVVFSAGIGNITMIGLDVTRTTLYGFKLDAALRKVGSVCAQKAAQILSAVGEEDLEDYRKLWEVPNDPVRAIHDVLAMACLDDDSLFEYEFLPIRIALGGAPIVSGQSLIDRNEPDHPSVRVAVSIDKGRFIKRLVNNLANLP